MYNNAQIILPKEWIDVIPFFQPSLFFFFFFRKNHVGEKNGLFTC